MTVGSHGTPTLARASDASLLAESIFAPLKPILDRCDLRVANLESALTRCETRHGTFGRALKAPPG